uniref:Uncharacterized protein n=1 Tax=Rhizophora mucronata TaxID=61149 RepID=A0A2P2QBQ8_RHIMU
MVSNSRFLHFWIG